MADLEEIILKKPLYLYDLPKDLLDTLVVKSGSQSIEDVTTPSANGASANVSIPVAPRNAGEGSEDIPNATSCGVCSLVFKSVQEQRSHVRSDLHSYNVKQKLKGRPAVSEAEFEQMIADLDESLSGSESSSSGSDEQDEGEADSSKPNSRETALSTLLKRQANLQEPEDNRFGSRKRKRGPGKAPILWLGSSKLPSNTSLGVYRALFTPEDLESDSEPVEIIKKKQILPKAEPTKPSEDDGGVALPSTKLGRHIFLCMIGGGHFAAMIVSLAPKVNKRQGIEERQASVVAHKTFHRYTTRRKQGGAQAANDMARGPAHSAGSSLRRYNEVALTNEVRGLLSEWKEMIDTSELLFIRAAGGTNRQTLFGHYEGQVLHQNDARNRGFPFSTRRATQSELMRCFVELTRLKVSQVDEAALAAAQQKAAAEAEADAQKKAAAEKAKAAAKQPDKSPEEEMAMLHTSQIEALIRRSKAPGLASYISSNALSPDFRLQPMDSPAHHHAPTPLHMAASMNSPALVNTLLVRLGAEPTVLSGEGKTAFQIAGDRATRDAFRLARSELGEERWEWAKAHVPDALSKTEVEKRAEQEREEESAKEAARRAAELERLKKEEMKKAAQKEENANDLREKKMGKGKVLGERQMTAEEKREEETRGMTPEMRMRLEREKRARAAEERMRRIQGSGSG